LRAFDADAEYAGFDAVWDVVRDAVALAVDVLVVELVEDGVFRCVRCAASAVIGRHTLRPSNRAQTRTTHRGRIKRTNPP